jgi:hypothetical protein
MIAMSLHLNSILPAWLSWFLIAGLVAILAYGTVVLVHKKINRRWILFLSGLRLVIIGVFLLILFQPVLSTTRSSEQLPEMMILVDTSRSMAQPGGPGKGTRLEEVVAALEKTRLGSTLAERFQLNWFHFAQNADPVDGSIAKLKPTGSVTRYADSLTAAWNHLAAVGKSPERMLLVSDGNDLGKADPVEAARSLGLVIDTLAPTSRPRRESRKVEIADVQCARRVLLGSETHFRATLTRSNTALDQPLTLRLLENGKKVWDQDLVLKAGQGERTVTLAQRPTTTGTKNYEFQIVSADAGNKSKPFPVTVQVVDSKYEVLILEDTWRWEFKYLRRLFEEDPSFRFTALLSRGSGSFVQFGSPDRRVNLVGFPQGRGELEGFDTFILGDVNPERWPSNLALILSRLVSEEGKTLVVVAGPNLDKLAAVPELHQLLPVELNRDSGNPVTGPVDVRIRADSSGSPFFFQVKEGEGKLSPLDQVYAPLRKRPAATILLEAKKLTNSYGKLIVVAEHPLGKGRVLFLGTDTLWKWHTLSDTGDGPTPYSQFWQQAFRALTPGRSQSGAVQIWLQPNRTRAEVGRPIVVHAEIQSLRPLPRPKIQATVELPDKRLLPLAFAADPGKPNVFRAEFESPVAGPHTIKAAVATEGKSLAEGHTVVHMEEPRGEDSDNGIDHANLARLANATGGKIIEPDRPETWPAPAESSRPIVTKERAIDLWSNFTLILILSALLAVDWVCRIMKGYI